MDAFEAFTHGQPDVKPQHRSLYYFLLGYARKRGNVPRFTLPFEMGMDGSRIGSWTTYDAAIKALHGWGFIVYTPGANRYKVPVVELTFRNPSGDELLSYWQAYCLAYPVELQNRNPSPIVELQNLSSTPSVELQNRSSTANPSANPSGDNKKSIRDKEHKTAASAEGEGGLAQLSASSANEQLDSQPVSAPTAGPAPAEATTTPPRAGCPPRKRGAALPTGPAELLPASCLLAELLNPGGLAAKVQQMAEPLTLAQAERLLLDFSAPVLREIFCEMANYRKLLTASTSANLTARNWLTRRGLKPGPQQPPLLIATSTPVAAEAELDEAARQFRAELAAREEEEQNAHLARWAARPLATA